MKIDNFFKYIFAFIGIFFLIFSLSSLMDFGDGQALYGLLIIALCFLFTLITAIFYLKLNAENDLKTKEFERKENVKNFEERIKKIEIKILEPTKIFLGTKELFALLKDFEGEKLEEFKQFVEWTKTQK